MRTIIEKITGAKSENELKKEFKDISRLVSEVSEEYIDDITEYGYIFMKDFADEENIKNRFNNTNIYVAKHGIKTIGVLEITNKGFINTDAIDMDSGLESIDLSEAYLIQLFHVKCQYREKGIGRALFQYAMGDIKYKYHEKIIKMYVHSTKYAEPVYKALGFEKIGRFQEQDGIGFVPMLYGMKSRSIVSAVVYNAQSSYLLKQVLKLIR
jgi:ribosomal protein S18 acetylase RimI-like enzyme